MKRTTTLLFLTHVLTRVVYSVLQGVDAHYSLQPDALWLVQQADEIVAGNYSLDIGRFIASPLYPFLVAGFKILSATHWDILLSIFQIVLSAISGVYIYRLTEMLFRNRDLALSASLLYAVFPMTLWYVNTFSQESIFQSLFILALYYLVKSLYHPELRFTLVSSLFFSLAYLTKSHILLFALFIPLIYFHRHGFSKTACMHCGIYAAVALLFSLPFGLYQQKIGNGYVISSNGAAYQFYLGNTQAGYISIVELPERNSPDYKKMKDINYTAGYFNGSEARYDSLMQLSQQEKQAAFFTDACTWISDHPGSFVKMKIYDLGLFLFPGVSHRHYPFMAWLFSFMLALPIYFGAYVAMIQLLRRDFRFHAWMAYLFLSMLLFSVIWYVQNRFRTITLEPLYIVLAAYYAYYHLPVHPRMKKLFLFVQKIFQPNA